MKKLLSLIFTFTLVMGLSVTALAESTDVKGTYNGEQVETVYSVDITWESMEFTYNDAFKGEWDPATHSYKNATEASWTDTTGTITVTNHSNAAITASPTYQAKPSFESASMTFSSDALNVATADNGVDGAAGTAVTGTITVTPTGSLPEGTTNAVIGTITVTIE